VATFQIILKVTCFYASRSSQPVRPSTYIILQRELSINKRQCTYKRNIEVRSRNHCCQKAISITYSECVSVALVMHHATRMRRVISSSVAGPTLTIFFHIIP